MVRRFCHFQSQFSLCSQIRDIEEAGGAAGGAATKVELSVYLFGGFKKCHQKKLYYHNSFHIYSIAIIDNSFPKNLPKL
jgi:hypothetical protein